MLLDIPLKGNTVNKLLITAVVTALVAATPALAHKKKEKHVECLVNEIYDAEANACIPLLNDGNDSFVNTETDAVVEADLDWPGKSDDHRQDKDRAQRTGNNGRGTGDALDRGDPPGKGNTKNDNN